MIGKATRQYWFSEFITTPELKLGLMRVIFRDGILTVSSFATNKYNLDGSSNNANKAANDSNVSE